MSDRLKTSSIAEQIDWLRLYRSEGVGSHGIMQLTHPIKARISDMHFVLCDAIC